MPEIHELLKNLIPNPSEYTWDSLRELITNPQGFGKKFMEGISTPEAQALSALDPMLGLTMKSGFLPRKNALYVDWLKTDSPLEGRRAIRDILSQVKETGATKIMFHPENINEAVGSKRSLLDMVEKLGAVKIPNENTMMLHPLDLASKVRGMGFDEWQRLFANYGISYLPEKYGYEKLLKGFK